MTATNVPADQKDGGRVAEPVGVKDGAGEVVRQESPVKAPPAGGKKGLDYPDRQLKGYKTR